jgi:Tol biopolymer transport system component
MTIGTYCVGGPFSAGQNLYVFDRFIEAPDSASSNGTTAGGADRDDTTSPVHMSADGQRVVFTSLNGLVPEDANRFTPNNRDTYVWDRLRGPRLLSGDLTGNVAEDDANGTDIETADISADGNTVALVSSRRGDGEQVYVVDVTDFDAPVFTLASQSSGGTPADGPVGAPSLSNDGSLVAFAADAPALGNAGPAAYLHDVNAATTTTIVAEEVAQLVLSGDGSKAFFWTSAALDAADENGVPDLYRVDVDGANVVWLSQGASGAGDHCFAGFTRNVLTDCVRPATNEDGSRVVFHSGSAELSGFTNDGDAYLIDDIDADVTPVRLSVSDDAFNGARVRAVSLSRNGRFASFDSPNAFNGIAPTVAGTRIWQADLEPIGPPPPPPEAFCRALIDASDAGQMDALATAGDTIAFNAASGAMASLSANDGNGESFDVYTIVDVDAPVPELSSRLDGQPSSATTSATSPGLGVRANGDVVLAYRDFNGDPTNEEDDPQITHVYVKNLTTGELELIDRLDDGTVVPNGSFAGPLVMSADGTTVAFFSRDVTLAQEHALPTGPDYLYVWREATGTLEPLVIGTTPVIASTLGVQPVSISANGNRISFESTQANLVVPGDTDGSGTDLFVHDFTALATVRIGGDDAQPSGDASLSADGNRMIFTSAAQLVAADTNSFTDLYFVDDIFGARTITRLVASVNDNAGERDNLLENLCPTFDQPSVTCGVSPHLSADGARAVFLTGMPLAGGRDHNSAVDIYVVDTATGVTELVTRRHDGGAPFLASLAQAKITSDGTRAVFFSNAIELFNAPYVMPVEVSAPMVCDIP